MRPVDRLVPFDSSGSAYERWQYRCENKDGDPQVAVGPFEKPSMARYPYHLSRVYIHCPWRLLWKLLTYHEECAFLDFDQITLSAT